MNLYVEKLPVFFPCQIYVLVVLPEENSQRESSAHLVASSLTVSEFIKQGMNLRCPDFISENM